MNIEEAIEICDHLHTVESTLADVGEATLDHEQREALWTLIKFVRNGPR